MRGSKMDSTPDGVPISLPTPAKRRLLNVALVIFFTIQVLQVLGPIVPKIQLWPFAPYSMFADPTRWDVPYYEVILTDDRGGRESVLPGNTLPIEHFRAFGAYMKVFSGHDDARKMRLARVILDRLNTGPWGAFDQTYAAARPVEGTRFTAIRIVVNWWNFKDYRGTEPHAPMRTEVRYEYSGS